MGIQVDDKPISSEQLIMTTKGIKELRVNTISGKDPDGFYVCVIPSLNISGYGRNKDDALESLDHNIQTFVDDLKELGHKQRIAYLNSMGWSQESLFHKRYSKPYINFNGELKNFKIEEPQVGFMATELA